MYTNTPSGGRLLCYLALLLLVPGCGGSTDGRAGTDVPRLALENELRIGSPDDPEYSFGWFRSLVVGPDAHIYTLHPEEQVIREHDASGRLVRKIGGEGEGPGEFKSAGAMGFLADTLWVFDYGAYRLSYFDGSTGELIDSRRVPVDFGDGPDDDPPRPSGLLPDGTMLARTMAWSQRVASGEITEMVQFRWTRDGELIDTLAVQPLVNTTWEVKPPDGSYRSYMQQPFARAAIVRISSYRPEIVRVERDPPEGVEPFFRVIKTTFDGDTVFDRSFPYDPVPIPPSVVDSLVDLRAQGMGERAEYPIAEIREWARSGLYVPETFPPVEGAVPGMDGSVWLQLTDDGGPLTWFGLAPDGHTIGAVDASQRFRLLAATSDRWWGVETDELDVPYIVRYDVGPRTLEQELEN